MQTVPKYHSLHIHQGMVYTSHFIIFSRHKPGGGSYIRGPSLSFVYLPYWSLWAQWASPKIWQARPAGYETLDFPDFLLSWCPGMCWCNHRMGPPRSNKAVPIQVMNIIEQHLNHIFRPRPQTIFSGVGPFKTGLNVFKCICFFCIEYTMWEWLDPLYNRSNPTTWGIV